MKAVVFDQPGPPEDVLHVRDVPQPAPGRGEVLVRMIASPINPSDLMYVHGNYGLKPKCPATPGFEGVGVVEASGGGLLGRFLRGRRVVVMNDRRGNWSEYTVAAARQCIPVPADLSDEQAASFFVNPATAVALTRHVLAVPPGGWLLQTAAGSALGKMVIRLGRRDGFHTFNVVRRREQVAELKALGADEVVCEDDPIEDRLHAVTGGLGAAHVIDPVGGATGTRAIRCLAPGGRAVLFGLLSGESVTLDPRFLITGSKSVQGFWLADWAKKQGILKKLKLIRQIRGLLREGVLTSDIAATHSLDEVRTAVREAAVPGKKGKILLRIAAGR
ncbi:zinc-dependent alcohol dehydrogenase family protein [Fimbriiglobus ruber]|uniref:Putative oxidoreductase n=1 Tax=Fimbriiglobus ruber TaxID=1908690 RepID=A0A225EEV7_9BACT|nr:zinc-dependent alcohol dehydrogenase family protein [Fimbriiglobus ruber]OWK46807.1 putative oxidoreductase [Fimbriiglobus ruber]